MVDDAVTGVAVLLWVTTAIEALHLARRGQPEPALQALLLTFAFLAVSATFFAPAAQTLPARALGVANINEPIARTALLGAAWSVQVLLLRLQHPAGARTSTRRRGLVLIATLLALWGLFAAAPVPRQTRLFAAEYGSLPIVAAYLAVSLAYLAFALVDVIRGVSRYARSAPRPLAVGLRLLGLGCLLGLGYVTGKTSYLIIRLAGSHLVSSELESSTDRSLAVGAFPRRPSRSRAGLVAGLPEPARPLPAGGHPLRRDARISLDPQASPLSDRLRLRDVQLRLYRRVIEIRDGRLDLAGHLDPGVIAGERERSLAAGLSPVEADAAGEAAGLLAAIQQQDGVPAPGSPPPSPDRSATLPEEVDWLLRVVRRLQRLRAASGPPGHAGSDSASADSHPTSPLQWRIPSQPHVTHRTRSPPGCPRSASAVPASTALTGGSSTYSARAWATCATAPSPGRTCPPASGSRYGSGCAATTPSRSASPWAHCG